MDPTQQHQAQSADDALAPAPVPAMAAGAARRERPQKEAALNCPRCNSANTKFCYYNNYSLTQPRYFCRTCRRYWTEGGALRNVPVGRGSRKRSRPSSAASAAAAPAAAAASSSSGTVVPVGLAAENPRLMHEGAHDLKLVFPHHGGRSLEPPDFAAFPSLETSGATTVAAGDGAASSGVGVLSAMDLLRSTDCYAPLRDAQLGMPTAEHAAAGFGFRVPVPAPNTRGEQEGAVSRLLFSLEDMTLAASADGDASAGADDQGQGDDGGEAGGVVTAGHETTGSGAIA